MNALDTADVESAQKGPGVKNSLRNYCVTLKTNHLDDNGLRLLLAYRALDAAANGAGWESTFETGEPQAGVRELMLEYFPVCLLAWWYCLAHY